MSIQILYWHGECFEQDSFIGKSEDVAVLYTQTLDYNVNIPEIQILTHTEK